MAPSLPSFPSLPSDTDLPIFFNASFVFWSKPTVNSLLLSFTSTPSVPFILTLSDTKFTVSSVVPLPIFNVDALLATELILFRKLSSNLSKVIALSAIDNCTPFSPKTLPVPLVTVIPFPVISDFLTSIVYSLPLASLLPLVTVIGLPSAAFTVPVTFVFVK